VQKKRRRGPYLHRLSLPMEFNNYFGYLIMNIYKDFGRPQEGPKKEESTFTGGLPKYRTLLYSNKKHWIIHKDFGPCTVMA